MPRSDVNTYIDGAQNHGAFNPGPGSYNPRPITKK